MSAGGPPPPHRFGTGDPFSVGLEEELLLVDADTLALAHVADQVLPGTGLPRERIDHEAFLAELEVRSEPSASVGEAIGQLAEGRARARRGRDAARRRPPPRCPALRRRLVQSERYERVERQMRGLIKRTPECALHVHVGVPDPEAAVAAMNGLRELLPLLHGLGANSPFWFGADSGLASSRAAVIRAYPGRGIPPVLNSWDDYLEPSTRSGRAEAPPTTRWSGGTLGRSHASAPWSCARWTFRPTSIRPQPSRRWGGRSSDGQSRSRQGRGSRASPPLVELPSRARRTRRGDLLRGGPLPLREVAGRVVAALDHADPELEGIDRIVRDGNGADRQRAAYERGGMPGLLRYLADVTKPRIG